MSITINHIPVKVGIVPLEQKDRALATVLSQILNSGGNVNISVPVEEDSLPVPSVWGVGKIDLTNGNIACE